MSEVGVPAAAIEAAMRAWGVKGEDQRRIVGTILEAADQYMHEDCCCCGVCGL